MVRSNAFLLPTAATLKSFLGKKGEGVDEKILENIIKRINSRELKKNRYDAAIACGMLWKDLLQKCLFASDRRESSELCRSILSRVLALNGFSFDASEGELVYISSRILDDSISFRDLARWIEKRIAETKP